MTWLDEIRKQEWRKEAACKGKTELFFPPDVSRDDSKKTKANKEAAQLQAMSICASCPVREPCFDFAMRKPEGHGVWAGTSIADRRRLTYQRRKELREAQGV